MLNRIPAARTGLAFTQREGRGGCNLCLKGAVILVAFLSVKRSADPWHACGVTSVELCLEYY